MAMMKYGRTMSSPKTTDPKTGARIADPAVSGKKIKLDSFGAEAEYTSWPEFREMIKAGRFKDMDEDLKRRGVKNYMPQQVKDYLSGITDQLSEEFDEPLIRKLHTTGGPLVDAYDLNYKPGSKTYNSLLSKSKSEEAKLKSVMSKKDWDIMTKQTKDLSPEGGIPVFGVGEVLRHGGNAFAIRQQHPSRMTNTESYQTEPPSATQAAVTTPTEPPKPKKIKVTEKVVEKVDKWRHTEPKTEKKTVKRIDISLTPKDGGAKKGLRRKITNDGDTRPGIRMVEKVIDKKPGRSPKREQRLWETYEVGSYKGQNFRGMTEDQLRGLTKQARQDKRGAMFEGDFNYSKSAIKKIKEARKYAGRENVAGLASVQEKVTPETIYESKVWTGQYKDESGKIYPDRVMKTDEQGNLSPINQPIKDKQGETIISVRDNPENKKYDSGFYALKKGGPSKNKKFTTEYQYGYAGSDEWKEAGKAFRSSMDNATNRNTLQSKIVTAINRQKLERQSRKNRST